jgi:hypothetical protein
MLVLLDFKRSKGSNPSFPAWEEDYPKIQLWFYLQALVEQGQLTTQQRLAVGYLFFKDMDKSWLACDSTLAAALESHCPAWAEAWDDSARAIARYADFEAFHRQRLLTETVFAPQPRSSEVCDSCALRPLCPRGDSEEEAAE